MCGETKGWWGFNKSDTYCNQRIDPYNKLGNTPGSELYAGNHPISSTSGSDVSSDTALWKDKQKTLADYSTTPDFTKLSLGLLDHKSNQGEFTPASKQSRGSRPGSRAASKPTSRASSRSRASGRDRGGASSGSGSSAHQGKGLAPRPGQGRHHARDVERDSQSGGNPPRPDIPSDPNLFWVNNELVFVPIYSSGESSQMQAQPPRPEFRVQQQLGTPAPTPARAPAPLLRHPQVQWTPFASSFEFRPRK